jgi:hypothetical protein
VTVKEGEKVDKGRLTQVGRAMKELGVKMIAAYSPQARGRSERSFGTWQGRLPQELRLAGINTVEGANSFLREKYVKEFNDKFSVAAAEKGTVFRRTGRSDLNWIFSVQTERVVAKDNTVAIRDRCWQIDKTRFRHSLAGTTVTIHEHLDETVSIRYGPHVVGRYRTDGEKLATSRTEEHRGKGGSMEAGENQKVSGSHTPWKSRRSEIPTPTAPATASVLKNIKAKPKPNKAAAWRPTSLFHKADRSLLIEPDNLTCYRQGMGLIRATTVKGAVVFDPPRKSAGAVMAGLNVPFIPGGCETLLAVSLLLRRRGAVRWRRHPAVRRIVRRASRRLVRLRKSASAFCVTFPVAAHSVRGRSR